MTRRHFGKTLMAPALLPAAQARRPNIVLFCSDQHSGLALRANGDTRVRTPNLDRLASQGVNFGNAYSGNPVCVPARASLMSGMYASDVGSYCNSTPFDGRVPTWANRLRQAGYRCWASGKLDLEKGKDFGLEEVRTGHGHSTAPDITSLFRRPLSFRVGERRTVLTAGPREQPHADAELTRRGLEFLRGPAGEARQPWAMYLGLVLPHPPFRAMPKHLQLYAGQEIPIPRLTPDHIEQMPLPYQALRNFKLMSAPIADDHVRRARTAYYAMITEMDEYLGLILDEVEKSGGLDNTLFIYTSDHGEMLGEHGLWLKNVLLEPSARVPLIMAGAGLPKGKNIETPVSHVDMVASLIDAAGVAVPSELRGRSLLPLARGEKSDQAGFAFSESHSEGNCTGSFMIRKGDWKYVHFSWYGACLYNLKEDPGELHNLAGRAEYASKERELHGILTSLLDPDAVTERAFQEQERRLQAIIRRSTPAEFFDQMKGRLGEMQARALSHKFYRA